MLVEAVLATGVAEKNTAGCGKKVETDSDFGETQPNVTLQWPITLAEHQTRSPND